MQVTIIGKEIVDYPGKDGTQKRGVRLWSTHEPTKNGVEGLCCREDYYSDRYTAYGQALPIKIGDTVNIYFNERGYVDALQVVPPSSAAVAPASAAPVSDAGKK